MAKTVYLWNEKYNSVMATETPKYWPESEGYARISKAVYDEKRSTISREKLLKMLKPGDKVSTILRHVSSSGMSRRISPVIVQDGAIHDITSLTAGLLGRKVSDKGGIEIGGCGMDMGFELVYRLGSSLWPDGTPEPHGSRNGEPDTSGGYALKQEWL